VQKKLVGAREEPLGSPLHDKIDQTIFGLASGFIASARCSND